MQSFQSLIARGRKTELQDRRPVWRRLLAALFVVVWIAAVEQFDDWRRSATVDVDAP